MSAPATIVDALQTALTTSPPAGIDADYVRAFFARMRKALVAEVAKILPARPRRTVHPKGTVLRVTFPDGIEHWIKKGARWRPLTMAGQIVLTNEGTDRWIESLPNVLLATGAPLGAGRENMIRRAQLISRLRYRIDDADALRAGLVSDADRESVRHDPRRPEVRRGARYLLKSGAVVAVERIRPELPYGAGSRVFAHVDAAGRSRMPAGHRYDVDDYAFQALIVASLPDIP